MGWLPIAAAIVLAWYFSSTMAPALMWLSIATGVVGACSFGLMHNHAVQAASRRHDYTGRFGDITEAEADSVPDFLAWMSMSSAVATVALIVVAIVRPS